MDEPASPTLPRKQAEARRVAAATYEFRGCVVCGLTLQSGIMIAHLDQHGGNHDADNLAYLCGTHHWMYDAGLYPVEAIRLLRAHWQKFKGVPDHSARMKTAGADAARTRKRKAAARQAVETRRENQRRAAGQIGETPT